MSATLPPAGLTPLPVLRRRPVPESEPYPAVRVLEVEPAAPSADTQATLSLQVGMGGVAMGGTGFRDLEPLPTPDAGLPEPGPWAAQFVRAAVEIGAGARSPAQLVRWCSPSVHAMLCRRAALAARLPRPASPVRPAVVRSVRVCRPRDGACEASAVVLDRGRVRAVAVRMESLDGRWQVTALLLG